MERWTTSRLWLSFGIYRTWRQSTTQTTKMIRGKGKRSMHQVQPAEKVNNGQKWK